MLDYESNFVAISYHEEDAIVAGVWKEASKTLDDEAFKIDMLAWLKSVQAHQPVNILAQAREYYHSITPELQLWANEHILANYLEAGVKKLAFVVPSDLFAQVSIEQTIEEKQQTFQVQYFEDEQKAKDWLKA